MLHCFGLCFIIRTRIFLEDIETTNKKDFNLKNTKPEKTQSKINKKEKKVEQNTSCKIGEEKYIKNLTE